MHWRLSANLSFFGAQRNRFTRYQPDRSLDAKFELAADVTGIEGVEVKYPADFEDLGKLKELLARHEMEVSAVNVGIKDAALFRYGALSARSEDARRAALDRIGAGMDMAAELGADIVTTCPLADGYDYPFQVDHGGAWERFIETASSAAAHRRDVRLCLEFQPTEPHARIMLSTVGKMLHVCARADAPNLGANLDVGHAFAAGESPAESAQLLDSVGKLFYIHANDNTGEGGDWDMISGSVHFWHWLEFLHTLRGIGYEGWIGADIAAKHFGPTAAFTTNASMIRRMSELLDRLDPDRLRELVGADGRSAETFDYLSERLLPEKGRGPAG